MKNGLKSVSYLTKEKTQGRCPVCVLKDFNPRIDCSKAMDLFKKETTGIHLKT